MILEGLISIAVGLFDFIVSAFGNAPAPGWLTGLAGQLDTLVVAAASMGGWVPWSSFGTALAAVIGAATLSLVVRVVRILVSLFTGGGGSAA